MVVSMSFRRQPVKPHKGALVNRNTSPDKNKTRVLIVDDEYPVCTSIAGMLDYLGYAAYFVHTAADARAFIDKSKFIDLVLLDINLGPGGSGIDLLPDIRKKSTYTQVIMFTSEDKLAVGVECMRLGAYDYMTKPFDEQAFVNKAAGALERKKKLQLNDLYLGILFHDLKNPLQVIVSGVDLLRMSLNEGAATEMQKKSFYETERAISQILLMIDNIVSISKFETSSFPLKREPFVLRNEAEKTLALFNNPLQAGPKTGPEMLPYSLHFSLNDDFTLVSDRGLFCHVLTNIVSNALRHATGASKVVVEFLEAEDPKGVQVNVTNKGSFIEDSARDGIFSKFSSVECTASQGDFKNHGLGLTFSKMAVEAMGGRIWISSEKNVPSTTFHFTVKNGNV
jgi:two-component system, sensor histidine kinase and response regulator